MQPEPARPPSHGRLIVAGAVGALALGSGLGLWARPAPSGSFEPTQAVALPRPALQIVLDDAPAPIGRLLEVLPDDLGPPGAAPPPSPAETQVPRLPATGLMKVQALEIEIPEPAPLAAPMAETRLGPPPIPKPQKAVDKAADKPKPAPKARIAEAQPKPAKVDVDRAEKAAKAAAQAKADATAARLAKAEKAKVEAARVETARVEKARVEKARVDKAKAEKARAVKLAQAKATKPPARKVVAKAPPPRKQAAVVAKAEPKRAATLAKASTPKKPAAKAVVAKRKPAVQVAAAKPKPRAAKAKPVQVAKASVVRPKVTRPKVANPNVERVAATAPKPRPKPRPPVLRGEGPLRVARFDPCASPDPGEAAVCADRDLSARDRQLQRAYRNAEAAGVPASALRRQQDRWLQARAAAAREANWAVEDVYVARIAELNDLASDARED